MSQSPLHIDRLSDERLTAIAANDILETPRERLRRRALQRLQGGTMSPYTGGPKGRFVLVRDRRDATAEPVLLLSGGRDEHVAFGERLLAEALIAGEIEIARASGVACTAP